MKFKLMKWQETDWTGRPDPKFSQAVTQLFDAPNEREAESLARRRIRWLQPTDKILMEPVIAGVSLGVQLWEPCEKCGQEPSYAQPTGHLCAKCAQTAHPKITTALHDSTEPEEL